MYLLISLYMKRIELLILQLTIKFVNAAEIQTFIWGIIF